MNPTLYATLRSVVQAAIAWLFVHLPFLSQFADQSTAVEWVMTTVVFAGYVALSIWLANRTGDSLFARGARLAAKVMMLGLVKTPVYPSQQPPPAELSR